MLQTVPENMSTSPESTLSVSAIRPEGHAASAGVLIINADDWGRTPEITDRIADCIALGTVSAVSAMLFMEDSERAAEMARQKGIDAGVHLNFTTPFTFSNCSVRLMEHQQRLTAYLRRNRLAQTMFHPSLARSFEYVVSAQIDEFRRLYHEPARFDGHHHMHLCANVVWGNLLPAGTIARRNFSFQPGEKSVVNRLYRKLLDRKLARRHHLTDYLYNLTPVDPSSRLQRIFSLARHSAVELETHPVNPAEYQFLAQGEIFRQLGDFPIASAFALPLPQDVAKQGDQ
jgi:YdjC-like protein